MSHPLPPVDASAIDWKLVASAAAVFIATAITTIWGWFQGRKKSEKDQQAGSQFQIAGAVLQDNTSLRENTQASRDLRDQMFLLIHVLERHVKTQDDLDEGLRDIHKDLEKLITRLDKTG